MIRVLALLWIAILASSLSPVAAQAAITWTVDATASGGDLNTMSPGDTLLIDITVRSDGEAVTSIGGSVYGFAVGDDAFLVGGLLAGQILSEICIPSVGCFNGLDNTAQIAADPAGGDAGVQILEALSLIGGITGTGEMDPGYDGVFGAPQFQVILSVVRSGTIYIGSNHSTDGVLGNGGISIISNDA